jgi:hypothetical protein
MEHAADEAASVNKESTAASEQQQQQRPRRRRRRDVAGPLAGRRQPAAGTGVGALRGPSAAQQGVLLQLLHAQVLQLAGAGRAPERAQAGAQAILPPPRARAAGGRGAAAAGARRLRAVRGHPDEQLGHPEALRRPASAAGQDGAEVP